MYFLSKFTILRLVTGIIKLLSNSDSNASIDADIIYGLSNRQKLIPLFSIAMISVLEANFEVKNITATKVNSALNRLIKYGRKLR